jgi:hypothetical protein
MRKLLLPTLAVVVLWLGHLAAQTIGPGIFSRVTLGTADLVNQTSAPSATCTVGDMRFRTDGGAGSTVYICEAAGTTWQALAGIASAVTFTNKTYDAEGTGNVLTVPFTKWIQGGRCDNATATAPEWSFPTSNPGVPTCQTGSNTQYGTLDFADGAPTLSAQTHLMLPADFTGTLGAKFKWFTTATSGSVVWQIATICVADAETSDPAFNTASTVTDGAKGTTLQLNDATIASVTITGCAAGELLYVRVFRDPAHASDTLAATARLIGMELTYRRAM